MSDDEEKTQPIFFKAPNPFYQKGIVDDPFRCIVAGSPEKIQSHNEKHTIGDTGQQYPFPQTMCNDKTMCAFKSLKRDNDFFEHN